MGGRRRALSAATAAVAMLALTACGGDGNTSTGSGGGGDDDPIKIGVIVSLTGPAAAYGVPHRDTVEALAKSINASGGINGRQIQLLVEDDATDPTKAAQAASKLIRDKIVGFVGASSGTSMQAIAPILAGAKIPMVSTNGNAQLLDTKAAWYPYFFVANAADETASKALFNQAVNDGAKKIAVLYSEDGYGKSGLQTYESMDKPAGVSIVSTASAPAGSTSVSAQVTKIQSSGADAVILQLASPTLVAAYSSQSKAVQLTAKTYGSVGVGQQSVLKVAGTAADGMQIPLYISPSEAELTPDQQQLYTALKGAGYTPRGDFTDTFFPAQLRILVEAIGRAKTISGEGVQAALEDGTCVKAYMYQENCYSADNHAPLSGEAFKFATVKDGKFVLNAG